MRIYDPSVFTYAAQSKDGNKMKRDFKAIATMILVKKHEQVETEV